MRHNIHDTCKEKAMPDKPIDEMNEAEIRAVDWPRETYESLDWLDRAITAAGVEVALPARAAGMQAAAVEVAALLKRWPESPEGYTDALNYTEQRGLYLAGLILFGDAKLHRMALAASDAQDRALKGLAKPAAQRPANST